MASRNLYDVFTVAFSHHSLYMTFREILLPPPPPNFLIVREYLSQNVRSMGNLVLVEWHKWMKK